MSAAKAAMVSALSSSSRLWPSTSRASSAAASSCSRRCRCSRMRSEASAMSRSVLSTKCQMRSSFRFTSSNSASMVSRLCRCSLATPSISSSSSFTKSRMLLSVRMWSLMLEMMISSNDLAFSLGVWQEPLPSLRMDWQT
ncbi:MAG: hypothetical protein F4X66_03360 [Chloroflexi bacterium]|nr:hypothetical protein [Chloroflexota bacterium]